MVLLKLLLVPALIAGVTLAARRWGPRVGGLLTALPVVAGPTLTFYAVEQGNGFAAIAAEGTLLGLVAVGAFSVAYAATAMRFPWTISLLAGWVTFGLVTLFLYRTHFSLSIDLFLTVAALLLARECLPSPRPVVVAPRHTVWDLPLRMSAAVALVLALTSLAGWLGPNLSGVLTPFPVATSIIAGFTHAQRGRHAVVSFFRGFLPGLTSFAVFCFVLAATLGFATLPVALGCALAAQLMVQALIVWRMALLRSASDATRPRAPDVVGRD